MADNVYGLSLRIHVITAIAALPDPLTNTTITRHIAEKHYPDQRPEQLKRLKRRVSKITRYLVHTGHLQKVEKIAPIHKTIYHEFTATTKAGA